MKTCTKCGVKKPLFEFSKRARSKDGRKSECKVCACARHKTYYAENRERVSAKTKAYREANTERVAAKKKAYVAANEVQVAVRKKKWRDANMERARAATQAWKEAHPGKVNACSAKRHATKLRATPPWLTFEHHAQIAAIYAEAARLGHHVDHVVPLRGKTVCGLHVPWNLDVVSAATNLAKNAHCWPDCWDETAQLKYMLL